MYCPFATVDEQGFSTAIHAPWPDFRVRLASDRPQTLSTSLEVSVRIFVRNSD
jgi:hypothetical protein